MLIPIELPKQGCPEKEAKRCENAQTAFDFAHKKEKMRKCENVGMRK
jgi:hypothetical protein